MKFDCVVGNPPYLQGLWQDFLRKSCDLCTYQIAMIAPNGTDNLSERSEQLVKFLCDNGIQAKRDCTDAFPTVISGKIVTYFIDKSKEHNPNAMIQNSIEGDIVRKVLKHTQIGRLAWQGQFETMLPSTGTKRNKNTDTKPNSDTPTATMTTPVVTQVTKAGMTIKYFETEYTARQIMYSVFLVNRFFGEKNCDVYEYEGDGVRVGKNVLAISKYPEETIESFKSVWSSNLYKLVLTNIKNGQTATTPANIKAIYCPPLTRVYSDTELADLFGLTEEEKEFVNNEV